jgi:hypothetical protein
MEYPILMADIIDSRKVNSKNLMFDFKNIVNSINAKWSKEILSPLTITLGDEFQGIINSTENVFKIIFDIEEIIIKKSLNIKLRYVVNLGKIDTMINNKIAYEMLGEGLTLAREKLNELKSNRNRFQIITKQNIIAQDVMNDLFKIYENYVDSWKHNEFYIVNEFLQGNNYKVVAEKLNVNISSSWRRQKSLNIEEYLLCKKIILNLNSILYV